MISKYDAKDCDRVIKARERQIAKQQKFAILNQSNQRRRKAA